MPTTLRGQPGTMLKVCLMFTSVSAYTQLAFLGTDIKGHKIVKGWVPIPLRAWFWIPLVAFMVLTSIGLEIALYHSKKYDGNQLA